MFSRIFLQKKLDKERIEKYNQKDFEDFLISEYTPYCFFDKMLNLVHGKKKGIKIQYIYTIMMSVQKTMMRGDKKFNKSHLLLLHKYFAKELGYNKIDLM